MSTERSNRGTVVLVVEDEVLIREDVIDVLEQEGFRVARAANVQEALSILDQRRDVNAVFTDIQMPGRLDGLDLAHRLAVDRPAIAVLVTSGRSFTAPADLPDASRFIPKPYMPREVARILREMVDDEPSGWGPGLGETEGNRGSSPSPS
jgi:CheY-like chemotaxis protein